jgi:hypothetical protein
MLVGLSLKLLEDPNQKMQRLLYNVVRKRKALLYLLLHQKKQQEHVLNTKYNLAKSVYEVLF